MNTEREMTLSEWCGQLPECSVVNRELAELRGEIDRLRDMLALAGEDEMGRQQTESNLQFAIEERDALKSRVADMLVAINEMGKTAMGTLSMVIAERDALQARINGAVAGFVLQAGDDESGFARAIVHCARTALSSGPNLIGKRVALVVLEPEAGKP